ncbi:MAG: ABC transporter substrate-binding protein [Erysipelotrichaceae bacterium]|nr:ABC transporter substrate-binding protein [Erysipelotrichaceae bacterium]
MKKLLVLLLAAMMLLAPLAGCSKDNGGGEQEISTITLDMSTLFIVPNLEATQKVEDVLNDYLLNTLHETFKVHLIITAISDYFQKIPMELASGGDDAPDVVQVFSMADWVNNGYILALDDYLGKELKPTVDLIGNVLGSGKMAGHTYMIPRYFGTVLDWKFIYNKKLVEDAGVDVTKATNIDNLGDVLAELKTAYPDEHFLVYCDQFNRLYGLMDHTSVVGTYAATVGTSTTLKNYYETDAYKNAIYKAYEFRQKGYADPEGSANTLSHDAVVMGGSSKGVIMGHSAQADGIASMFTKTNTYGAEFGAVTIGIDDLSTDTLGIGIAHYCKDPAAAARFINLLYTDEFVWITIIYGAEGQDYVWNADHTKVKYPDGMDFNSVPYNCIYSCGMIGNGFQGLEYETSDESGSDRSYGKELMNKAWCPPLYGFTPTTVNVMNEIAAVSNVVDQYNKVLIYGDVNPDEVYPQFLAALKEAGIEKIVADYQAQADEWLRANG